jgi:NADPH:quinone reductase-like Zn-dependent oxidoreductase
LIDFASITGDDIVLVTVASSSAALSALQMAKAEGATVISPTKKAFPGAALPLATTPSAGTSAAI